MRSLADHDDVEVSDLEHRILVALDAADGTRLPASRRSPPPPSAASLRRRGSSRLPSGTVAPFDSPADSSLRPAMSRAFDAPSAISPVGNADAGGSPMPSQGRGSIGRAPVSKTGGWGFESSAPA